MNVEPDIADIVERHVEQRMRACKEELRAELIKTAHQLRQDDDFMRPASQRLVDHAGSHLFDKAARRLLWLVLGLFGTTAIAIAAWIAGSKS